MNQYKIVGKFDDTPIETVFIKWAHDEKEAKRLCLHKNPEKDGKCVFKRGATGRILSITMIDGDERFST